MDKPTAKQRSYKLERAGWIAAELLRVFTPAVRMIATAGSVRRRVALVHDIDLVAWPIREESQVTDLFGETTVIYGGPEKLVAAIQSFTKEVVNFSADSRILHCTYNEIPVEIYLSEPDGSNFQALLQMRTGPAQHNAWLARRAQSMKLFYHAGYGIYKAGNNPSFSTRVDDGTERGIYAALDLPYPEPSARI